MSLASIPNSKEEVINVKVLKHIFLKRLLGDVLENQMGLFLKQNKHACNFFKDVSFYVSFHVKFGNMRCCDFSINKVLSITQPPTFLAGWEGSLGTGCLTLKCAIADGSKG